MSNKKPAKEKQQGNASAAPTSPTDKELIDAAERVYRRYGNDLSAFYRDAQKELVKRG